MTPRERFKKLPVYVKGILDSISFGIQSNKPSMSTVKAYRTALSKYNGGQKFWEREKESGEVILRQRRAS